jgi:hypothetical protein
MAVTVPSSVSTANVDSAADDPKLARADIKTLIDAVNTLLGQINALGITQLGDGLENEGQAGGTKDKTRVKLDGSSLARSASGLKVNAVTTAMLEGGTASPGNSKLYGTDAAGVKGFFNQPGAATDRVAKAGDSMTGDLTMTSGAKVKGSGSTAAATGFVVSGGADIGSLFMGALSFSQTGTGYLDNLSMSFSSGTLTVSATRSVPGGGVGGL